MTNYVDEFLVSWLLSAATKYSAEVGLIKWNELDYTENFHLIKINKKKNI